MIWKVVVLSLLLLGIVVVRADDIDITDDNDDDGIASEPVDDGTVEYQRPEATPGKFYFAEHFDDPGQFEKKWIKSKAKKEGIDEDIAKYDGVWALEEPSRRILRDDLGLVLKSKAKHHAIASRLQKPFVFAEKPFVVQYEVQWQDGQECGGSYIKLLSSGKETTDLSQVSCIHVFALMQSIHNFYQSSSFIIHLRYLHFFLS